MPKSPGVSLGMLSRHESGLAVKGEVLVLCFDIFPHTSIFATMG